MDLNPGPMTFEPVDTGAYPWISPTSRTMDRAAMVRDLAREHRETISPVIKAAIDRVMADIARPLMVAKPFEAAWGPVTSDGRQVYPKGA